MKDFWERKKSVQAMYKTIKTIHILCYPNAKNSKLVPLSSRLRFLKSISQGYSLLSHYFIKIPLDTMSEISN